MKEYISKERAKQFVCGHCNEVCSEKPCESSDCDWMAFIDKEPAADVAEVVRCRECLCYTPVNDNTGKCVFLIGNINMLCRTDIVIWENGKRTDNDRM